jgi:hypothetical protein
LKRFTPSGPSVYGGEQRSDGADPVTTAASASADAGAGVARDAGRAEVGAKAALGTSGLRLMVEGAF